MTTDTEETTKVLPCPFCGNVGLVWFTSDIERAGCSNDDCPAAFLDDGISLKIWNTRLNYDG